MRQNLDSDGENTLRSPLLGQTKSVMLICVDEKGELIGSLNHKHCFKGSDR